MSHAFIPSHVIDRWPEISLKAKAVVVAIASFMNGNDDGCYPSVKRLVDRSGLRKRDTVHAALRELVEKGLVVRRKQPGASSTYNWPELCDMSRQKGYPVEQGSPFKRDTPYPTARDNTYPVKQDTLFPSIHDTYPTKQDTPCPVERDTLPVKRDNTCPAKRDTEGIKKDKEKESSAVADSDMKDSINGRHVWAWWVVANRDAGRRDPISAGPDTNTGKTLAKKIQRGELTESELRECLSRYLRDEDKWLKKQGHALRHPQSRLNAYLNDEASLVDPEAEFKSASLEYANSGLEDQIAAAERANNQ